MPFFHDTTIINPISSFGWLGSSVGEILWYVLTNPIEVITNILSTHGKLTYILALFGVLGFISLLKPAPLVLALPIFAISLLSQYEGLYGLGHHYTAGLIPPIIIAFAFGLPRAKLIWRKAGFSDKLFYPVLIFGLILSHVILSPSPIGRLFWSDKIWSYNYRAYIPLERDEMIKTAIAKHIPTDPGVIISLQNTLNISSLVQPHYFHLFPDGVTEEQKVLFYNSEAIRKIEHEAKKADFVIIDLKRPWFIIDKGCSWLYGECTDGKVAKDYLYWVDESKKVMDIEFKNDGFMILRRKQ